MSVSPPPPPSQESASNTCANIRNKPPHLYDNLTRRMLPFGITFGIITFVGLIVRYAVQEFDPSVSTITVTTSQINNKDIASLSVSKNFLERILEFIEQSIAIVAVMIPLGFPLCTIFNRYFAKIRAGRTKKIAIKSQKLFTNLIPKYVIIGDSQLCQMPHDQRTDIVRLRPLVRDTIFHLIKSHVKVKLILEENYEDARRFGIRIGLIGREHHKLAIVKSCDLLKLITDSSGDIKQNKVRYLLSRMKILSQSTPADKSLLLYLMKHCETLPNENVVYLAYNFTDPEAMRLADCSITFNDCDDEDVKKRAQVIINSQTPGSDELDGASFTNIYRFVVTCLIAANITHSYALYQIGAAVSCCLYRFLSIAVFQEQLLSHSHFNLVMLSHQFLAIFAILTKWLLSLAQTPMKKSMPLTAKELSSSSSSSNKTMGAPDELPVPSISAGPGADLRRVSTLNLEPSNMKQQAHHRSRLSVSGADPHPSRHIDATDSRWARHSASRHAVVHDASSLSSNDHVLGVAGGADDGTRLKRLESNVDDTLNMSSSLKDSSASSNRTVEEYAPHGHLLSRYINDANEIDEADAELMEIRNRSASMSHERAHFRSTSSVANNHHSKSSPLEHAVRLSGTDLNMAIINSKLASSYRQTFFNTHLIDDVTYRLVKLHIAYQMLVMIIIMIFGNSMFQLDNKNYRQQQTLAFNSVMMNNLFNLANCLNQSGEFDLKSGFKNHPFFICILLFGITIQVSLTELNAFGLENLNPTQWFVCFVFALLSSLIAPLTGEHQQQRHHHQQQQKHPAKSNQTDPSSNNQSNERIHNPYTQPVQHNHHVDSSQSYYYSPTIPMTPIKSPARSRHKRNPSEGAIVGANKSTASSSSSRARNNDTLTSTKPKHHRHHHQRHRKHEHKSDYQI